MAMATSYKDVLQSPPSNLIAGAATLSARVHTREGVKARQVLVDAQAPGQQVLKDVSNTHIADTANKALTEMEEPPMHKFVSAR